MTSDWIWLHKDPVQFHFLFENDDQNWVHENPARLQKQLISGKDVGRPATVCSFFTQLRITNCLNFIEANVVLIGQLLGFYFSTELLICHIYP